VLPRPLSALPFTGHGSRLSAPRDRVRAASAWPLFPPLAGVSSRWPLDLALARGRLRLYDVRASKAFPCTTSRQEPRAGLLGGSKR
jgi:hypothetical protein